MQLSAEALEAAVAGDGTMHSHFIYNPMWTEVTLFTMRWYNSIDSIDVLRFYRCT